MSDAYRTTGDYPEEVVALRVPDPDDGVRWPLFCRLVRGHDSRSQCSLTDAVSVESAEGHATVAKPGDWVVFGPSWGASVCRRDSFEVLYEPV